MEVHLNIGELAKAAGCQAVTVRFYERRGLLGSAIRSQSNYRMYGEQDLERLLFIRNCRALGLTLKEINDLVAIQDNPTVDCHAVNACLDDHLAQVERQMQTLQLLSVQLKRLRNSCMSPRPSSECGVLAALASDSLELIDNRH